MNGNYCGIAERIGYYNEKYSQDIPDGKRRRQEDFNADSI